MPELPPSPPSDRTKVKRAAGRAEYDRGTIARILDDAFLCHVGAVHDGVPRVIPFVYARLDDQLYLHGSTANRVLRDLLRDGAEACITVTHLDGLVLGRSAFHHSVNYRSVVIYGRGRKVTDEGEKERAFRAIVEHAIPGRYKDVRAPNQTESLRTLVVAFSIAEASAKVRAGDPIDEEEDYALACWAGQIPLRLVAGTPIGDTRLEAGIPVPAYVSRLDELRRD